MPVKPHHVWLFVSFLAVSVAWLYMQRVLLPWEQYANVEVGTMKASLGDLYSPWLGTRALLRQKKNPYGPEVTHEIQMAIYGHDVAQGRTAEEVIDQQRFAYPVYAAFLLAPAAFLDFETVHTWAPPVLAVAVAVSVWLWLSALRWRGTALVPAAVICFVLASPQVAQGLRLQQLGLVVALLLALGTWLVVRSSLTAGGATLALATIKPQMVVIPVAWFLLWSLGDLRRRWRLPASFLAGLAILAGAGEWILPGWTRDFFAGLAAYRHYGPVGTLLQLFLGDMGGMIVGTLIVAGLLAWSWHHRKCVADSPELLTVLSWGLLATTIALPRSAPFSQVLLILPALQFVQDWEIRPRAARVAFAIFVCWPLLAQLALLIISPPLNSSRLLVVLPSALVLLFPFALAILLAIGKGHSLADADRSPGRHVSY
jgi:hypothetical protein